MSPVSLSAHNLILYSPAFYPADINLPGNFVGVAIWSAVEPIVGILGAVSIIVDTSLAQSD